MQAINLKQMTFTSRNPHIRIADNIARRVNEAYPRVSSTKLDGLKYSFIAEDKIEKMQEAVKKMRGELYHKMLDCRGDYVRKSQVISEMIKAKKLGNCHESAILAEIAAKVNDIRNCYIACLKPKNGREGDTHDHAVLYVDSVRKPYIIDPWLGFADFVPNALERYRTDFRKFFEFETFMTDEMYFEMLHPKSSLTREGAEKMKNSFPELIL